jgi:hypothetical protein
MDIKSPKEESPTEDYKSPTSTGEETKSKRQHQLEWTDQIESLLSGWADTAAVYKWLHDKSHRKYKRKNKFLSIPIMVLSLITGSLGIGLQGYVPPEYMSIGQGALGGMGIFIGIMQGLQTQFGWAQRSEKHASGSLGWGKLHRNIQIELAVEREFRKDCDSFVKVCRMEYDRLTEQSPAIPSDVLDMFKIVFKHQAALKKKYDDYKGEINTKATDEEELILPDICDTIKHTKVYKAAIINPDSLVPNVYNNDTNNKSSNDNDIVIKTALTDRIKELDEKMSGITQFKLASMGNRFAPIQNLIEHQIESDRKRANTVHNTYINKPHKKLTEFEGIPRVNTDERRKSYLDMPRKPLYGLPPLSPRKKQIDTGVNIKNLINRFTINSDRSIELTIPLEEVKEEEVKEDEVKEDEVKLDVSKTPRDEDNIKVIDIPKLDLEQVKKDEFERQNKDINDTKQTPSQILNKKNKKKLPAVSEEEQEPLNIIFRDEV